MHLKDYISEDLIFIIPGPKNKLDFLETLVARVKDRFPRIDERALFDRLIKREEEVSTGIGHGVAIPHATVEGLQKSHCVIAKVLGGVDFDALDGALVHTIFLLISPPEPGGVHLRLLARIARFVMSPTFIQRMASAQDTAEIYASLVEEDSRHV